MASSKARPTHFLCIPLSSPQLAASLAYFRTDVSSSASYAGSAPIPEGAIRPTGTMHLTLGVMSLAPTPAAATSPEGKSSPKGAAATAPSRSRPTVGRAVQVLNSLRTQELWEKAKYATNHASLTEQSSNSRGGSLVEGQGVTADAAESENPISISFKGMQSMGAPVKTSVLYIPPVDPDGMLHRFCGMLRDRFVEEGVMEAEDRPLKLHATVVNTIYVKSSSSGGQRRSHGKTKKKEKIVLDATEVLKRYETFEWDEDLQVNELAICKMGAKKVGFGEDADEVYEVEAKIGL